MDAKGEQSVVSEEYLDGLLTKYGNLGPKVDDMPDHEAEERIRVQIARMESERQQAGLWSINKVLKKEDVPASVRLHLITATVHLSLHAQKQRSSTELQ